MAAEGLFLTWGDCALGGAGGSGITFACDINTGDHRLYLAFSLSQPLNQVLGIEAVVDLQTEADPLPDWWHFEAAGPVLPAGCRENQLSASRGFSADHTCVDPWAGTVGDALIQDYQPGEPYGGTHQARIRATAFLSTGPALTLDATDQYYGLKLILSNAGAVPPQTVCAGCPSPTCLVLNSIWLRRPDVPGGDVLLTTPGAGEANWARWQQGGDLDCAAVPVHRSTWGHLKSLYRR